MPPLPPPPPPPLATPLISNPADLAEVWLDLNKGRKVVLWCDGLKSKSSSNTVTSRRRPARESDEDEMDEDTDVARRGQKKRKKNSAQEEREEKVQRTVQKSNAVGHNGEIFPNTRV